MFWAIFLKKAFKIEILGSFSSSQKIPALRKTFCAGRGGVRPPPRIQCRGHDGPLPRRAPPGGPLRPVAAVHLPRPPPRCGGRRRWWRSTPPPPPLRAASGVGPAQNGVGFTSGERGSLRISLPARGPPPPLCSGCPPTRHLPNNRPMQVGCKVDPSTVLLVVFFPPPFGASQDRLARGGGGSGYL